MESLQPSQFLSNESAKTNKNARKCDRALMVATCGGIAKEGTHDALITLDGLFVGPPAC